MLVMRRMLQVVEHFAFEKVELYVDFAGGTPHSRERKQASNHHEVAKQIPASRCKSHRCI